MRLTVCILITNNKLTQSAWADYIQHVEDVTELCMQPKHFTGFSNPVKPWQNACWVGEMTEKGRSYLEHELVKVANLFGQESIAVVVGMTTMLKGE